MTSTSLTLPLFLSPVTSLNWISGHMSNPGLVEALSRAASQSFYIHELRGCMLTYWDPFCRSSTPAHVSPRSPHLKFTNQRAICKRLCFLVVEVQPLSFRVPLSKKLACFHSMADHQHSSGDSGEFTEESPGCSWAEPDWSVCCSTAKWKSFVYLSAWSAA